VNLLYFNQPTPLYCSTLLFPLYPVLFKNLQCISMCLLPTQMKCILVLFTIYHSLFLSLLTLVSSHSPIRKQVLHIYMSIRACLYLGIRLSFGSIFHIWEKTYDFCLSDPGLLHLTWLSSVLFTCKWQNFILLPDWVIFHYVCVSHFLNPFIPSVGGHLECVYSLASVFYTINMGVQVSLLHSDLFSFWYMPQEWYHRIK
jgi:hypothetical protein